MSSVAAPIMVSRNGITRSVGAISIAGPTSRVLGGRKDAVVASVLRATRKLSSTLSRVDVDS
ncbi:IclR family transcriptional regulator C-terminal domain-containing protein [Prauserella muralis]|uniref:IclR family transcriptional regulator C-terminal domain-containing protein n=1 Tax=Prauserella muralis TaxID=588067 RepID=UPI0024832663|nr:IclR family transcriptional regulator C-terminal domain-containing protein [Prauserella muralis]